ncbi:chaperone protein dnaJ 49 [Cryptomeria japonica]|uniref:chaperone protein dnaJ 49 n=1 Tax=Cryptomeria japonica TaxID=3369 RepID=UPI0025AC072E|nr:chaperone protein dnaJ 49 [Cryptomeria japonica]XP_057838211.1 chaperone protein dnaJ 49 [Cryptomeria japonica]
MESNKDEAFRCIHISKRAYEEGDRTRAQRFLCKAKRLYPDLKVDSPLFVLIEDAGEKTTGNDQGSDSLCREISKEDKESNVSSKNNENYDCRQRNSSGTIEFSEVVHHIRKSKDYYEILGLERDCSQTEIRKAFRKLSLKVHPDKNKFPGAEEAFKAVSAAFNCLSNPEQRGKYDNQNIDEVHDFSYEQYTGRYKSYEFCNETSETFANFFFKMNQQNAGFQGPRFFRTHKTRGDATADSVDRTRILHFVGLVQLLAIVMLVLVNLMPNTHPSFSMNKDASYQYECLTSNHGVSFFVKRPDFQQKYPPGSYVRKNIDDSVERNYKEFLAHNCRVEVGLRMWGRTEETPSCDALRQFSMRPV